MNRRLAGWAAKRIIAHEALCRRLSWVHGCPARRQVADDIWPPRPSAQRPSPSPACHHGSYCCTVAQSRWLVSALVALRTMEIVQLLKCIMCIAWTFSTSPQRPPTTYMRVNDFRPHRDSLFRGATYTRERLIHEYIRYNVLISKTYADEFQSTFSFPKSCSFSYHLYCICITKGGHWTCHITENVPWRIDDQH